MTLAHSVSITMPYSIIAWKHLWSLWATNSYTHILLKDSFEMPMAYEWALKITNTSSAIYAQVS